MSYTNRILNRQLGQIKFKPAKRHRRTGSGVLFARQQLRPEFQQSLLPRKHPETLQEPLKALLDLYWHSSEWITSIFWALISLSPRTHGSCKGQKGYFQW
jgi:hypothetical protein